MISQFSSCSGSRLNPASKKTQELRELLKNNAWNSASQRPERPSAQSVASAFSSRPWETGEESGPSEGATWGRGWENVGDVGRWVFFLLFCFWLFGLVVWFGLVWFVCLIMTDSSIDWLVLKVMETRPANLTNWYCPMAILGYLLSKKTNGWITWSFHKMMGDTQVSDNFRTFPWWISPWLRTGSPDVREFFWGRRHDFLRNPGWVLDSLVFLVMVKIDDIFKRWAWFPRVAVLIAHINKSR